MDSTILKASVDNKINFAYPIPKRQLLDSSKMKEFADDKLKFEENGRNSYKQVEDTEGNWSYLAISPFPPVFSKDLY